jgi:hypothetical protein
LKPLSKPFRDAKLYQKRRESDEICLNLANFGLFLTENF